MNLKFSKNASRDIEVLVQDGTEQKPFSYIEMIKSLLDRESLKTEFTLEISEEEKEQIEQLIGRIRQIAGVPIDDMSDQVEN